MTTIFNKIHRLKRQPDWTWDHFLSEIEKHFPAGLDEKTLYSHYRLPHKKATSHVGKVINLLHGQCFPDPFPEAINRLMRLYNNLANSKKHLSRDKDIEDLEFFLIAQLDREDNQDLLRTARINWLLGNIQFDRIPTCRDNGRREQLEATRRSAITCYENSVAAIEEYNLSHPRQPVGASHLYKARHNILACHLNAVPQEQRNHDPTILCYLKDSNYIPNSKQTLEAEPFQWSIARNGLRFSSLVENAEDVKYFFRIMTDVSHRFLDLDYEPLGYGPISAGTDFQWAISTVLTPSYLDTLTKTDNEKKDQT